jgi:hypothetical protein
VWYVLGFQGGIPFTNPERRDLPNSLVICVYPGLIDADMPESLPFYKKSPSALTEAIIDALEKGTEEIFPDVMVRKLSFLM